MLVTLSVSLPLAFLYYSWLHYQWGHRDWLPRSRWLWTFIVSLFALAGAFMLGMRISGMVMQPTPIIRYEPIQETLYRMVPGDTITFAPVRLPPLYRAVWPDTMPSSGRYQHDTLRAVPSHGGDAEDLAYEMVYRWPDPPSEEPKWYFGSGQLELRWDTATLHVTLLADSERTERGIRYRYHDGTLFASQPNETWPWIIWDSTAYKASIWFGLMDNPRPAQWVQRGELIPSGATMH